MSKAYDAAIKARAVKKFIAENARSPTIEELRELIRVSRDSYPTIDEVGFSGFEVYKPSYKAEASALLETQARNAISEDMTILASRTSFIGTEMESAFRSFASTSGRISRRLAAVESRLDNLLLLNSSVDVFIYGIEEEFDVQDKVDFSTSTATVESGWVTLARNGYSRVGLSESKITHSVLASKGILSLHSSEELNSIKTDDGSFWEAVVTTSYSQGKVTLVLEVELPDPTDLSDMRVTLNPISVNKHTTCSVMVSLDGVSYKILEPLEQVMKAGENHIGIAYDGVKKLRILLTKMSSDDQTFSQNQYIYLFSIDSISLFGDGYSSGKESVLFCGPYEVKNTYGEPFNFTKAKLDCCAVIPPDTAINFFLSKTGDDWVPVAHNSKSLSVASFGRSDMSGTYELIDENRNQNQLIRTLPDGLTADDKGESLINLLVPEEDIDKVNTRTVVVKRNLSEGSIVYGLAPGWMHDPNTLEYTTTIYIESEMGRYIDFGSTTGYLNGMKVSGYTLIPPGYSTFRTQDDNWYDIETGINSVSELKALDPKYPYNHKLLIEGYSYPGSFTGTRVYPGIGEWFGAKLQYLPPEVFSTRGFDPLVYTIDRVNDIMYFRVKVNKSDSTWDSELFSIEYQTQKSSSNSLYVKAVLTTSSPKVSPRLDSFKVRTI